MMNDAIPVVEFIDNANQRTPCVLVLDASGSMAGEPLKQLNLSLANTLVDPRTNSITSDDKTLVWLFNDK